MSAKEKHEDAMLIGPEVAPGVRAALRRQENGDVVETRFRVAKEGEAAPPGSELVIMDGPDASGWRKVLGSYRSGPAQVATEQYRENYDAIFGKRKDLN